MFSGKLTAKCANPGPYRLKVIFFRLTQSGSFLLFFGLFSATLGYCQQQSERHSTDKSETRLPIDDLGELPDWNAALSGLPELPQPAQPITAELVELGRTLFFDGILSRDGTVSCATCHQPQLGFASADPIAIGIDFRKGKRNAPSLLNRGYGKTFFWDGRSDSLENQSLQPLENQDEMGHNLAAILETLRQHPEYPQRFAQAFESQRPAPVDSAQQQSSSGGTSTPDQSPITSERLAVALASFQRVLRMGNTEVDRFRASEYSALSSAARQGLWIFESRGKCWKCHAGDNFTDENFHNTGVSFGQFDRDLGRFEFTRVAEDRFRFKTPSLRGVALTAPYMHDGSMPTLEAVVEFYNKGGSRDDAELDPLLEPLNLSKADLDNLVEFLKALSR